MFRQLAQVIFNGVRVPLKPVNLLKPVNPTIISTIHGKIPGHIPRQVGFLRQYATATVKKTKPIPKKKPAVRSTVKKVPAKTTKTTKGVKAKTTAKGVKAKTAKTTAKGVKSIKGVKSVKSKPKVTVKDVKKKKVIKAAPKKKIKAKVVAKPKPKPKPKIKKLEVPKKPGSPYVLYMISHYREAKAKNPNIKLGEASKLGAEKWSALSENEKEIWNQRYQEAKAKYLIDFKKWHESLTPEQYLLENRRRRLLSKKKGKKVSLLKDPKAPKKPKSPYLLFLTSIMDDFRDLKVTERSKEAAKRWNELKPEDKKPYEELYLKDQARYKAEAEKYKKLYA
ncbi:hypothetical protein Glove_481g21 [Diversispora epigaea]|uniref:HMG box domain-containing protein n=1 Tax=Diversispora epigaea TaxID=1348612 RepID=A0A397GP52_9GLOM|nr:hypothetical protein Glove_481g21 [Diversispora epigaea]